MYQKQSLALLIDATRAPAARQTAGAVHESVGKQASKCTRAHAEVQVTHAHMRTCMRRVRAVACSLKGRASLQAVTQPVQTGAKYV